MVTLDATIWILVQVSEDPSFQHGVRKFPYTTMGVANPPLGSAHGQTKPSSPRTSKLGPVRAVVGWVTS